MRRVPQRSENLWVASARCDQNRGSILPPVNRIKTGSIIDRTTTFQFQEVRLKEFGSSLVAPERRSPEYLQKVIQSEIERWAALIKAAKIRLNESDRMNLGGR
jgi:hypothetical protein